MTPVAAVSARPPVDRRHRLVAAAVSAPPNPNLAEEPPVTVTARAVKIPPPIHQMPTCPLCDDDLDHDGDSLNCESCGVYWPAGDTASGRRVNEFDSGECPAEHAPYEHESARYPSLTAYRFRCVLDADHEGEHRGVRCDVDYDSENVHVWAVIEPPASPPPPAADPEAGGR